MSISQGFTLILTDKNFGPAQGTFHPARLSKQPNSEIIHRTNERGIIMKNWLILLVAVVLAGSSATVSYASDWDKAGKALTIIEGLRLVSGGQIDVVGGFGEAVTGHKYTNRNSRGYYDPAPRHYRRHRPYQQVVKHYHCTQERIWVPEFRWIKKHIPEHEEIHPEYGPIIVDAHYIRIKQEHGGHWEYRDKCH